MPLVPLHGLDHRDLHLLLHRHLHDLVLLQHMPPGTAGASLVLSFCLFSLSLSLALSLSRSLSSRSHSITRSLPHSRSLESALAFKPAIDHTTEMLVSSYCSCGTSTCLERASPTGCRSYHIFRITAGALEAPSLNTCFLPPTTVSCSWSALSSQLNFKTDTAARVSIAC